MIFKISKVVDLSGSEDNGQIWKQIIISILASLPFFTHGLEITDLKLFPSPNTPPNEVPWSYTAKVLASIVTAPGFCYIIERYGRRTGLYLVVLFQGLSCIPLFLAPNEVTSMILHLILGISNSAIYITIPIFIREINDNHRAVTLSLMMVMTNIGQVVRMMVSFQMMMYVVVVMVAVQFVMLWVMVESPSYLVMKKNYVEAALAMAKLNCLFEYDVNVDKRIDLLKSESAKAKEKGEATFIGIWENLIWRDLTVIGVMLYTITTLCGSIVFLDHEKTLLQLKLEKNPDEFLVYTCMLAGAVICLLTIKFTERKILFTTGYTIMVLSMGFLGVFTQADLTIREFRWAPLVCLGLLLFAYGMIRNLPLIVMTEMLNLEIRTKIIGSLYIYAQILNLVHEHTFKYIEDFMGIYTVLYVFAGINIYGLVYTLFRLPDIKNKSTRQIERQVKRTPLFDF